MSLLKGKEFNLKICHRKTHFHSCTEKQFIKRSIKSSSKILIFISETFYKKKITWKTTYEPLIQIWKRKEDITCIICNGGNKLYLPSVLEDCTCISENDDLYKEILYHKLITERSKLQ